MYRQFLADAKVVNPSMRVIGLTATPFRMKTGTICSNENILNEICFEVSVRELIVQGYLSPLRTKAGASKVDTSGLHVRGGEFIAGEVEDLMDTDVLVNAACAEIIEHTRDRSAVLIFSAGVHHGEHVARVLREQHGVECGFVEGNTPGSLREKLIERLRAGDLKYLANVNVLTTGFDAPNVDCVALLRPTLSPGLYYQMVGRGFRLHPGKSDCLVLDFGGNVLRHGPVDQIRVREPGSTGDGEAPAKECPECNAVIAAGYAVCPECGFAFPPPKRDTHSATATSEGILAGQTTRWEENVTDVYYQVHHKRDSPDARPTMRVDYRCGFNRWFREWICIEHDGYAGEKAAQWWRARTSEPLPETVEEAVDLANEGVLIAPTRITVQKKAGEKYERVVGHVLPGPSSPLSTSVSEAAWTIADEEIPF